MNRVVDKGYQTDEQAENCRSLRCRLTTCGKRMMRMKNRGDRIARGVFNMMWNTKLPQCVGHTRDAFRHRTA